MKILLLSATLIGAGLVIAGPAMAQPTPDKVDPVQTAQRNDNGSSARNTDQGMNRDTTTGLSSAKKERDEAGASPVGSNTGSSSSATSGISHNDPHYQRSEEGRA
jgi:hypothetical protein